MKLFSTLFAVIVVSLPLIAQAPALEAKPAPDKPAASAASAAPKTPDKTPDRAAAYYHYSLAHIYEELVTVYGRSEFAGKAIEEYKLALENDPGSEFLNAELAELYARTGRIRDAVLEAQEILKRDPKNLDARKLLGRIYLRSLGDTQAGVQSQEMLRLALEQLEEIVRLEPQNAENHLLLGRLYILNRELLKAESAFRAAINLAPTSEEALTNLAYLYNEEGQSQRAVALLESVPAAQRPAKIYAALGFSYERMRDYKKAIEAYRAAVELDSENLDSLRGLAQNLHNDGQIEAAIQQYRRLAEADPQDPQNYLRLADIQRRSGQLEPALESLKRAEALAPDSLEIAYNIALVQEAQGNFSQAIAVLEGLLKRTKKPDGDYTEAERNNRAVFLERLGAVYRDNQSADLALNTFEELRDLGADFKSRSWQHIIETYRSQRKWAEATRAAQNAVRELPEDRSLQFQLAGQLADGGQGDAALGRVRGLLKGNDDDREVYVALGQISSRLKRWSEAEEAIAQAERLSHKPEEKQFVLFLQGSLYERQKKFDAAERKFKQVLAEDPANPNALNYLGYMLADRGLRLEEALGYIRKALELDPQNGAYLDSLGWVYFRMNNLELAEQYLLKAIERMPFDSTIHDHVGDMYFKSGRLKMAAAHWERALAEWNRSVPADLDPAEFAKVQKKLENAKVKLARQNRGE
ncbi:MAG: tetratricopeptide repeat protein [Acidobacteria bacterium]|nr:tetratricopeptide repeat protein [Acidobacteriota bacterium]